MDYTIGNDFYILMSLLAAGIFSGLLAGVFGVGGGLITVPILFQLFIFLGLPEEVRLPMATATSLALIAPTSLASFYRHYKHGMVNTFILYEWIVPIIFGVFMGSLVVMWAPINTLKVIYFFFTGFSGCYLLFLKRIIPSRKNLPDLIFVRLVGILIGMFSMLMGIGGGLFSTMFLSLYGRPIHEVVSTSSGVGVLIALPGIIVYFVTGYNLPDVYPDLRFVQFPYALGYISIMGMVCMLPTTLLAVPYGVRIAYRLSREQLERMFGLFLMMVSARFIVSLL